MSRQRFIFWIVILSLLLISTLVISLGIGAVFIPPERVVDIITNPSQADLDPAEISIVRDLRLPRAFLAALVGAGLAIAGAAFQALFRNPLADPYVIGASSGASLGATIAITFGLTWNFAGFGPIQLAAFVGALSTVFLVYTIAGGNVKAGVISLLLAGTAISTVLSSVTSLFMLMNRESTHEIFSWLMGSFNGRSWPQLTVSLPYLVIGMAILWFASRPLDALSLGEDTAQTIGLSIGKTRGVVVAVASLITAAAVASSGVIGFVGLVAPHIARILFGASHHRLIPASAVLGGLLTLLADDLARTLMAPFELPVGLITSLIGGIFFLYLIRTRQRSPRGGL
mgnify:CR=1 FL=1